ncbi:protein FAM83H-like [Scleropages formosus]|uniref:Protein FAM83H-like n=1 Tax=Scleropages formosus TaxID=113540 RepID=A0A0N8JWZ0_SCLFO|nr:protein FAM83H-like [Scleropages formosus]
MMRVRTVSGTPYFCRTGKSFKGQMMGRFLLVDCRAVLSGNYSFMWSFEKIHRSIAHLFLGELVTTFDEEFRILYAQSEPLVMENALVPMPGDGSYCKKQFGSTRPSMPRNPRGYLHTEIPHFAELPGYPLEGRMDSEGRMSPFRRDEPCPGYLDRDPLQMYSNRHSSQQLNIERPFLEPDRPMISRQMDINTYKRHSYAEGSQGSSQQLMQHRIKHYPEDVESLGGHPREQHYYLQGGPPGPGSGHSAYNKVRAHGYHQMDQFPDQYELGLQPESEPPGSSGHMLDYLSSDSSKEMRYRYEQKAAPAEGRYGRSSTKRPSLGQPYACQSSPTQPHPLDQKQPFPKSSLDHQPQDPGSKQGLRKWRINSYLSTLENSGEEGMAEPLGPDAFDEPSHPFTEEQHDPETAPPGFSNRDSAQIPISKPNFLPRYGKPILLKASKGLSEDPPSIGTDSGAIEAAAASGDVEITEDPKHPKIKPEVQTKITPLEPPKPSSTTPESSIENPELAVKNMDISKAAPESCPDTFEVSKVCSVSLNKDPSHEQEKEQSNTAEEEQTKLTVATEPPASSCTTKSLINMYDPEGRFLYFKDLAAKQSSIKIGVESVVKSCQPPVKKTDDSEAPCGSSHKTAEFTVTEVQPSAVQSPREIITDKPEERCPVAQSEISPSPLKITEKLEECPSVTESKISESPLKNSTEKLDGHLSAPQPKISQNPVEIKVEKPVTSAALISKKSVVSQDLPECDIGGSEATLERSELGTRKQEAKSSCEHISPMAEEPKGEPPAPKSTPSALQEDTVRSPLPPSILTHTQPSDEELLKDATDAEKSEWMKTRGHKASGVALGELGETLPLGSSSSPDLGIVSGDKNETGRPMGLPGQGGFGNTEAVDMPTTPEVSGHLTHEGGETPSTATTDTKKMARSKEQEASHSQLPSAASKTSPSRYQASTTNVLNSSNLRDDTKVILERISANSQNRMEQAKQAAAITDDAKEGDKEQVEDKAPEHRVPGRGLSRFQRPGVSAQERESLLKRMESMRKEKKVYSRFEVGVRAYVRVLR